MIPTVAIAPQVGMLATVRNRRGVVAAVQPSSPGPEGLHHLVSIEYTDTDGPAEEQLLWELEPGATLIVPDSPPDVCKTSPMAHGEFDALLRATRWSALTPYVDPDSEGPLDRLPIASPYYGAIQVEDYQLVPLLRALQMPRIALLLADDVGLGKTVEAGLVLSELILRRRARRVLVLCPASLRAQWRQEMADKFSLDFEEVDREQTHGLRRRLGPDANPWRVHARIVASYHYLRQPDVLASFETACTTSGDGARLPWDLIILDEAHHLAPASFHDDSDLARMLGAITPFFEHRLFLSATPHNGHTRSFTGLLEFLDPVRFTRTSELNTAQRNRIADVLVRRLKSDINAASAKPRFCTRSLHALTLALGPGEKSLSLAFQTFRAGVRRLVATRGRSEQKAGSFAVEVLGKRLLSGPCTFAASWRRLRAGLDSTDETDLAALQAAERALGDDQVDDAETEGRARHAAKVVGSWLRPWSEALDPSIRAIDAAVEALGLTLPSPEGTAPTPREDARFEALCDWIDRTLRTPDGRWRTDERVVVFTEFKTTLDVVSARLMARYGQDPRGVELLYGGLPDKQREEVKDAFNNPAHPMRLLVATDAASEGLNLQRSARNLIHWDIPWNPSRLEQRNGRLDRHGQAREVRVHHFATDDDADLAFVTYVVRKTHTIRDELGSLGELFDAAFESALIAGEDVAQIKGLVDAAVERQRGCTAVVRESSVYDGQEGARALEALAALRREVDLSPDTVRETLSVAMGLHQSTPTFDAPDNDGSVQIRNVAPRWAPVVDASLRDRDTTGRGALPRLTFDPGAYIERIGELEVFRPRANPALIHLGHPLVHHAMAVFARHRFPGTALSATRWTVRRGTVPEGHDALLLVTVEEIAANELRETFHHWVHTLRIPVTDGDLGPTLAHQPASMLEARRHGTPHARDVTEAKGIWTEVERDVRKRLRLHAASLTVILDDFLARDGVAERDRAVDVFRSRQGELSALRSAQSVERLRRQIDELEDAARQGSLFNPGTTLEEVQRRRDDIHDELRRRVAHLDLLQRQLSRERERVLTKLLPRRFARRGDVQVLPVTVEIVLPGVSL